MSKLDLTGQVFNRLTVIEKTNKKLPNGLYLWKCLCSCGKIVLVGGTYLKNGHTQSCGCLKKENQLQVAKNNFKDLTGQIFGHLLVIQQTESDNKGQSRWLCECKCGELKEFSSRHLLSGASKSCGCISSFKELEIKTILNNNHINFIQEYSFENLVDKRKLRFDFAIFDNEGNLSHLIEYDGQQHTDKNKPFYSENQILHDNMKNNYCKQNNIKLIRLNKYSNINLESLMKG